MFVLKININILDQNLLDCTQQLNHILLKKWKKRRISPKAWFVSFIFTFTNCSHEKPVCKEKGTLHFLMSHLLLQNDWEVLIKLTSVKILLSFLPAVKYFKQTSSIFSSFVSSYHFRWQFPSLTLMFRNIPTEISHDTCSKDECQLLTR